MRNAVSTVSFEDTFRITSFPQVSVSWVPSVVWKDPLTIIKLFGVLNKYMVALTKSFPKKRSFSFLKS